MLVLSRKPGESIIIGDDIKVTLIEIKGDNIKVGIEAPKEIPVWRDEIVSEVKSSNIEAEKADMAASMIIKSFLMKK